MVSARTWEKGTVVHCETVSWYSHYEKCMEVLQKLKTEISSNLAIPLWRIYSK
jgi:hypothetical protein